MIEPLDKFSSECDERIERRIVRALDGELTLAERAELDCRLREDPEARRLMDRTARADRAAGAALREAFAPVDAEAPRPAKVVSASERFWRQAIPSVAAAILLVVAGAWLGRSLGGEDGGGEQGEGSVAAVPTTPPGPAEGTPFEGQLPSGVQQLIWQVWDAGVQGDRAEVEPSQPSGVDVFAPLPPIQGPRRTHRARDRRIYSVYDESDQTIYLLGVDRVRKTVHAVDKDL